MQRFIASIYDSSGRRATLCLSAGSGLSSRPAASLTGVIETCVWRPTLVKKRPLGRRSGGAADGRGDRGDDVPIGSVSPCGGIGLGSLRELVEPDDIAARRRRGRRDFYFGNRLRNLPQTGRSDDGDESDAVGGRSHRSLSCARARVLAVTHEADLDGASFDRSSKSKSWTRFHSDAELAKLVQERYPGLGFKSFEILERGVSGRVGKIRLLGRDGEVGGGGGSGRTLDTGYPRHTVHCQTADASRSGCRLALHGTWLGPWCRDVSGGCFWHGSARPFVSGYPAALLQWCGDRANHVFCKGKARCAMICGRYSKE